ncbi:flagellar biosynthetic protein FliR [Thermaerobacter marianensis DSM 12885]|uniref:Flagellar biosynthetic protein FliR n=1 Tax=Thermaerobacter marianensis (strain ATCC 700841 / DSM 12885 / JCM 10246 / 7p75a) TaxID=644966 RepID=E6SJP4_THEM7|nr:flagellar biosynthetic protein FliR [Thermaerobacter marianensis]ADU51107.1 flagellar biosynthetic protein FliR [Thermaerobacter marianensis DSM 12885]
MDLAAIATTELNRFLLCLARTSGLVVASPVFGGGLVPAPARAFLAVLLALSIFPLMPPVSPPATVLGYGGALLAEVAVGLALGLVTALVFAAVQLAGQLLDLSTGFGLSGVFDPVSSQSMPVLGHFLYLVMWAMLLATDGHHLILRALAESYRRVPPGGAGLAAGAPVVLDLAGWMFATGLMLSLPVLAVLVAVMVALGLVSRAVPQFNVFITGLPVQVAVTLVALLAGLPALAAAMTGLVQPMGEALGRIVEAMAR